MQVITISGNLGRDSELRQTRDGQDVLSFSVAVKQGFKRDAEAEWFRCSIWGNAARSLKDYLLKGVKVVAHGDLTIGEFNEQVQFEVNVRHVELMSRSDQNAGRDSRREDDGRQRNDRCQQQESGGGSRGGSFQDDLDDDVPFITGSPAQEHRIG